MSVLDTPHYSRPSLVSKKFSRSWLLQMPIGCSGLISSTLVGRSRVLIYSWYTNAVHLNLGLLIRCYVTVYFVWKDFL
jgi:hypothetical protein